MLNNVVTLVNTPQKKINKKKNQDEKQKRRIRGYNEIGHHLLLEVKNHVNLQSLILKTNKSNKYYEQL